MIVPVPFGQGSDLLYDWGQRLVTFLEGQFENIAAALRQTVNTGSDAKLHTLTFTPKVPPDTITQPQLQGLDPSDATKPNLWQVAYEGRVKFTESKWYPPKEADVLNDYLHAIYAGNDFTQQIIWGQRYNGDVYFLNASGTLKRVLTKPVAGWGAMTGTATRTAFATYVPPQPAPASASSPTSTPASYSAAQIGDLMTEVRLISERLKALTDDLGATPTTTSHGLIGP